MSRTRRQLDELGAYSSGVNRIRTRNASGWTPQASSLEVPVKLRGGSDCTRCELHRNKRNVCIPGRGAKKPKFIFVGQAPGATEDKLGRCFVGPAGQLLDTLMAEAGFTPEETYMTNVAKCFPPNDRKPKKAEIVECDEWLATELAALPHQAIIVPVGDVATLHLTGKRGITKWAGVPIETKGEHTFYPILHPAYILRNPKKLPALRSQLRNLKNLGKTHSLPYRWQRMDAKLLSEKIVYEAQRHQKSKGRMPVMVVDFETTSKNPTEADAVCAAFYMPGWKKVLVADARTSPGDFFVLLRVAINHTRWICQNWKYEALCAKRWTGEWPTLEFDTMLAHSVLDENGSHALEDLALLVGLAGYDQELKAHLAQGGHHHDAPDKTLFKYNAGDVWTTWKLAKKFRKQLKQDKKLYRFYLEHTQRTAEALARIEWTGLYVNQKTAKQISKQFRSEMKTIQKKAEKRGVNLSSAKDVSRYAFEELGMPIVQTTKGGKPSMGKEAIEELQDMYPRSGFLKALSRFRSLKSWCTNFVEKHPNRVDEDNLLHGSFNVHVAVTGRLSSSDPNLQNIPREKSVKTIFSSRFKNGLIVQADYSQLELRILAALSGDGRLVKAFRNGEDIHRATGASITGKDPEDVSDDERHNGKTVNFGVVYGFGPSGLAKKAKISERKAAGYLRRWFTMHHGVSRLMKKWRQFTTANGYLRSPFGRVRHLPWAKAEGAVSKRALRQACNFPIQHAASELMCAVIAHLVLDDEEDTFRGLGLKSRIVATVHDSVYVDCPKNEAKIVAGLLKTVMEEWAPEQFDWLQEVPLVADVEIGKTMGG